MRARAPYQSPGALKICRPWSTSRRDGDAIGEIWYERPDNGAVDPSLLLKLLFTSQPLSIQVHPDDAFAHSMGLPNGKTEAWYVLSAAPEAKVALGLSRRLTPQQLREAIDDGSISDLVVWHAVSAGDAIFVPAGTIHAIGAGLVIAELQQRSDTTFRLFDHGRNRELHVESAILVADAGPADFQAATKPVNRRTEASRFQPTFRIRADRSGAKFILVSGSGARDMASRSRAAVLSPDRSTLSRAMPFSRKRTASTFTRRHRHGGSRGVHGRAARFHICCSISRSRAQSKSSGHRRYRCQVLSRKQRLPQRTAAWNQLNETPSARGLHRELSSAPLRHRDIYPRSSSSSLDHPAGSGDLRRRHDGFGPHL